MENTETSLSPRLLFDIQHSEFSIQHCHVLLAALPQSQSMYRKHAKAGHAKTGGHSVIRATGARLFQSRAAFTKTKFATALTNLTSSRGPEGASTHPRFA
jgi:hypothetical protein